MPCTPTCFARLLTGWPARTLRVDGTKSGPITPGQLTAGPANEAFSVCRWSQSVV
jgi:hypothetical protein